MTRAARESDAAAKHALLSPATAAAVELLAGVGATALDSSRAEGYAGEDGVLEIELLNAGFDEASEQFYPAGWSVNWDLDKLEVLYEVSGFEGNFFPAKSSALGNWCLQCAPI